VPRVLRAANIIHLGMAASCAPDNRTIKRTGSFLQLASLICRCSSKAIIAQDVSRIKDRRSEPLSLSASLSSFPRSPFSTWTIYDPEEQRCVCSLSGFPYRRGTLDIHQTRSKPYRRALSNTKWLLLYQSWGFRSVRHGESMKRFARAMRAVCRLMMILKASNGSSVIVQPASFRSPFLSNFCRIHPTRLIRRRRRSQD